MTARMSVFIRRSAYVVMYIVWNCHRYRYEFVSCVNLHR